MRNQQRPNAEEALIRAQVDVGEGNKNHAQRRVGSTKCLPVAKFAAYAGIVKGGGA